MSALSKTDITLRYFSDLPGGLCGLGAPIRFFLYRHGIKFTDVGVPMAEWPAMKAKLIADGTTTLGKVPLVVQDGKTLVEHQAILRRFARQTGEYGADLDTDYEVDRLASAVHDWRVKWGEAMFYSIDVPAARAKYTTLRADMYSMWETLLAQAGASGAALAAGGPSIADDMMYALLFDEARSFDADLLAASPRLKAFYDAYGAQPDVKTWCEKKDASSA